MLRLTYPTSVFSAGLKAYQAYAQTPASERFNLLQADAFSEIEVCSDPCDAKAPRLYYLGRQRYFSDFLFFLAKTATNAPFTEPETHVVHASAETLLSFLRKRQRVAPQLQRAQLICIIDELWRPWSRPGVYTLAPNLRSVMPLNHAAPHAMPLPAWELQITTRFDAFELFYDHLYAPTGRLQSLPQPPTQSKADVWRFFSQASRRQAARLVLLKDAVTDDPIFGAILHTAAANPQHAVLSHSGLLRPELLSPSAWQQRQQWAEALLIQYARDNGFTRLDLGSLSPRANTPAHQARQQLGCQLTIDPLAPKFSLHLAANIRTQVLQRTPLWIQHAQGLQLLQS